MINKVINDKIDIDKILIVTFTNAAASEMRERILDAIYKKIEENPDEENLQKQIILLNKASICTIHSFCLDVIRNHFYELDISANFRVGDTSEIELLKQEVLEDLFEKKYMENDEAFLQLINTYTSYRDDEKLKELILNIFKFIQSSPFPIDWLEEKVAMFNIADKQADFARTIWGKILLKNLDGELEDYILKLENLLSDMRKFEELEKFIKVIEEDIGEIKSLKKNLDTWDNAYNSSKITFSKWPIDKKITIQMKDEAKKIRDDVKKKLTASIDKILIYNSEMANLDILDMYEILEGLKNIIIEFSSEFEKRKKEKNIIDFNDIEHFALKLLINKDENGNIESTSIANEYKEKFVEIAIDEYQDSNLVQEYILNSISNGNNIFMVGDVKQSIYKFRQARPELFLEKYENYKQDKEIGEGLKIKLFKNFRSRENILNITNLVFENIMCKEAGDIEYSIDEFLNLGANYENPECQGNFAGESELHIIDLKEDEENEYESNSTGAEEEKYQLNSNNAKSNENKYQLNQENAKLSENKYQTNQENAKLNENKYQVNLAENQAEEILEENNVIIENSAIEAKFVANKIKELIEKKDYLVYDKKMGYRKITYKDIVILLRATSNLAPIYEKELTNLEIPVFSDTSSEFLDSIEIQTILSLLKIMDNPMQDIPFVSVLRSSIGGFSDDELARIRIYDKESSFYKAMIKAKIQTNESLSKKIENFLNNLKKWQKEINEKPLPELIWNIYMETNYYNYVGLMPNGALRQANLKMLFERAKAYEKASFKGLYNFINFIDKLHSSSGDMSSAKLIGENEDVVRIMSIHKSKGLEFPVVFLASTGKGFNMQDLNDTILMHQDIGFGPKYINYEKKIEYNTLAKEAIRINSYSETLSEEMRILYVALTRAKEKLFITGIRKDAEKTLKEKERLLELYSRNNEESKKINPLLTKKYKSYLDWIELVYLKNKKNIQDILKLEIHNKSEITKDTNSKLKESKDVIKEILSKINNIEIKDSEIVKNINWKYKYSASTKVPTKTSVTKIKELENENIFSMEENFDNILNNNIIENMKKNMKKNIDKNIDKDIHEKINEDINKNINKDVDKNIDIEINKNINKDVDKNIDKEINKNINKEIDKNINKEIDKNINKEIDRNINKEIDKNIDKNINENKNININENVSENANESLNSEQHIITDVPKFMKEEEKITGSKRGTLIHLCIQKMNEKEEYDSKKIAELIENLYEKDIITKNEKKAIDIKTLVKYTKSDLWKDLKSAKKIKKEQPFYISIPAKRAFQIESNEYVLVQGIIDLYFVDENDNLILVDYKTDYILEGEEAVLVNKYKKQLEIYKEALEKSLKKNVYKTYLFSTKLNKKIEIKE